MNLPVTLPIRQFWISRWLRWSPWPGRRDIATLTLRADGRICVDRADGTSTEVDIHPQSTVFSWLVVLLFRMDGRLESLVLPRTAMDAESHRKLRVWLKWKSPTAQV